MELLISEWLDALVMSAKVFSSLTVLELIKFGKGQVFFVVSGVFWSSAPVGDMIFSVIYAFDFVTFVFLDWALSIIVITSTFIAMGSEMASV